MGTLDGQVAFVTGAGRGIGRATALTLADAGAAVALVARTEGQVAETAVAVERHCGRAGPLVADVRDIAGVRRAVEEAEGQLGSITFLMNNAGTPGPFGFDWEVDAEAWWECVEVSLRGAFLCNQAVVPGMIARGSGRVVHRASTTGTQVCKTGENGRPFRRESYSQNGRRRTAKTVETVQRCRLMAYTRFGPPNSQNGQFVQAG